jgi:hypothetical protein
MPNGVGDATITNQIMPTVLFYILRENAKVKLNHSRIEELLRCLPSLLTTKLSKPPFDFFPSVQLISSLSLLCSASLTFLSFFLLGKSDGQGIVVPHCNKMAPRLLSCFAKGNDSSARNQNHANVTVDVSAEEQHRGGAVLVELFSSQGCKTSPEAELLVSRLGRGDFQLEMPVIVLAFHVDYWDYMGWKDPYGGSQWTVRQKAYVESLKLDTMFTPQIVVQGRTQCVGNEEEALLSSIVNAPRFPAPTFQVRFLTLLLYLLFIIIINII